MIVYALQDFLFLRANKDKNGELSDGIIGIEWYQDNHPINCARLRFSSNHTISKPLMYIDEGK